MTIINRQARNDYQNAWMKKRRVDAIALLGGVCVACGATDRLEFDHVDSSQKVTHRIWSWSWARILEELAKCQLLCHDCHLIKTKAFDTRWKQLERKKAV